jgi:exopolysaccharide production protein ExoZ
MSLIFKGYSSISEADFILKGIGSWKRFFLWGIPSAMLVFGLIFIEKNNTDKFIKSKILLVLGDASYSIYLTHQLFLLVYLSSNKRILIINNMNMDIKILLLTVLSIIIGYIFHKFFEIPILNYAKKKIN